LQYRAALLTSTGRPVFSNTTASNLARQIIAAAEQTNELEVRRLATLVACDEIEISIDDRTDPEGIYDRVRPERSRANRTCLAKTAELFNGYGELNGLDPV
jgi:hypothetical protein